MANEEEEFPWWGLWSKPEEESDAAAPVPEAGEDSACRPAAEAPPAQDGEAAAEAAEFRDEAEEIEIEDEEEIEGELELNEIVEEAGDSALCDVEDEGEPELDEIDEEEGDSIPFDEGDAGEPESNLPGEGDVTEDHLDSLVDDDDGDGDLVDLGDLEEQGEELLEWDGDEVQGAAASIDADDAFQSALEKDQPAEGHEECLLRRLRRDLKKLWPKPGSFELEPFGSFVTGLGLDDRKSRSDLDVVLLFCGRPSDSFNNDIRSSLVQPTIDRLGSWLRQQPGITVTNVIRKARVPIVMFQTKELSVDVSVQQPFGPMNSWHLRDLCDSGWSGRLRGLVRLVKSWAKSKAIHTAKDGSLSSYGWAMLAASYLQECGIIPALLPRTVPSSGPYLDSDKALKQVLDACSAGCRQPEWWGPPEAWEVDPSSEYANAAPEHLFSGWIDWMSGQVLGFLRQSTNEAKGCGTITLAARHIVSVRPRSQVELQGDIAWSLKKKEHWSPTENEVFLLIEEPLNGENVARCVRSEGFWAIHSEVKRALDFLASAASTQGGVKALLKLPPLTTRKTPWDVKPAWSAQRGMKRPWEGDGAANWGPPGKRHMQESTPLKRVAISGSSVEGKLASWRGSFGWIRPSRPVEGARGDGLIYVAQKDVLGQQRIDPDTLVRFSLYSDQRGLGAERVQVVSTISPKSTKNCQAGQTQKGGKGKGQSKAKNKAGPASKRERLTDEPMRGTVLEWKGTFGWIKPHEDIDQTGESWSRTDRIYVSQRDIVKGAQHLRPGSAVQFHAFVDGLGTGAEEVSVLNAS